MKHKDCIFVAEEDCPKDKIGITCEQCAEHKHYETIEKATRDFTGLGESFTDVFILCKTLIDSDGKAIKIETPGESIFLLNRVMAAFLSKNEHLSPGTDVYRRLIFYFFKILVDEFEEEEYNNEGYVH